MIDVQRQIRDILDKLERWEKTDIGAVPVAYTPTYVGGSSAGVTTYSVQVGYYWRFGLMIFFQGRVQWTAATGTGDARISLPATASSTTNLFGSGSLDTTTVTFAAGTPQMLIQPAADYFLMRSPATNAASTVVQVEAAGIVNFAGFFAID